MKIKLTQNQVTVVDDIDYEYLSQLKWFATKAGLGSSKFYAARWSRANGRRKLIYIHNLVAERMGLDLSCDIDNIDRNSLNNLRNNLRSATKREQAQNRSKRNDNTSGIPGVNWNKRDKKWYVRVNINGKEKHLGCFSDKLEAEKIRIEASLEYYKEFSPFYKEI